MPTKVKRDTRHLARRVALATLFCSMHGKNQTETCAKLSKEAMELDENEYDQTLTEELIKGTLEHKNTIDPIIEECAPQWPLDKIFRIDLVILEISIFELLIKGNTPEKVVIDEAVELAKEFGNDTSSSFVNGVLGTVFERKEKYVF